jgi:hypothetical protein
MPLDANRVLRRTTAISASTKVSIRCFWALISRWFGTRLTSPGVKTPPTGQHPRQILPMMARGLRSAQGAASGRGPRNARGGVRPRRWMAWARLRGARTALRLRRGIRTTRFSGLTGPIRTPEGLGLDSPTGAKVEDVALGLRAFKVVTAEGAALGLWALGLIADAAALGLAEPGPVAVGAEPGTGL